MKTHSLIPNTPEWLAYRKTMFNASDAPAMMGVSAYKTRTQLLHELHTGMTPDIDAATQRLFDDGHKFEAMARPLAEAIIGMELYPVTGSNGKLSASFDGLTMCETIAFEHKTLNKDLVDVLHADCKGFELPLQYQVQMEQQLMVSGADKCLFMASKWNGDTLIEERHCWYKSIPDLRIAIVAGWNQFAADLAAYVPPVAEVKAVAAPQFGLPAVSIQVNGSIALIDNLQVFGAALTAYIDRINRKPETDQDFADLEATVKTLKNAEDALDSAESGALAQTESIDTMRRTVAMYRDTARTNRLLIDKLVKSEKEARKLAIVSEAGAALATHIKALEARMENGMMPLIVGDFVGVVKGLKSIDSMRDKANTELARCKIEANAVADKITANLKAIDEQEGFGFLFYDRKQLALKEPEFVAMAIKNRISDHQAKEAERIAAETARIAEQERVKAEAAAQARANAEIAAARGQADAARASAEAIAKAKTEPLLTEQQAAKFAALPEIKPSHPLEAIALEAIGPPTLKLGMICTRLGFQVTADFLKSLGFEPAGRERAAVLFHESDFDRICAALISHISAVRQGVAA